MKIQDLVFFAVFTGLLYRRDARLFAAAGLVMLIVSIPLFAAWIFFTAERLTWYAAACFVASVIISLRTARKVQ